MPPESVLRGFPCNDTSSLPAACRKTARRTGIIVPMKENEIAIVAGPRTDYVNVLVSALNEESIPARIVAIPDVESAMRPDWACTPGDEIYVVVPSDKREQALELTRWLYRVCAECETSLLPRVRACQKCGALHAMEPGPHLGRSR